MRVGPYKVTFKHEDPREVFKSWDTLCRIIDVSGVEEKVLAYGCAYLHPNDNFCKNTGRKIALARALKKFGAHKELRTKFWQAYYAMRGGKW